MEGSLSSFGNVCRRIVSVSLAWETQPQHELWKVTMSVAFSVHIKWWWHERGKNWSRGGPKKIKCISGEANCAPDAAIYERKIKVCFTWMLLGRTQMVESTWTCSLCAFGIYWLMIKKSTLSMWRATLRDLAVGCGCGVFVWGVCLTLHLPHGAAHGCGRPG